MDILELIRIENTDKCTVGILTLNFQIQCYTLEPPQKGNQRNISCIPTGQYRVEKYNSPKFKRVCFSLHDVFGRDYISMHAGNRVGNTKGCILVGQSIYDDESRLLTGSNMALDNLLRKCGKIAILKIRNCF